MVKAREQLPGVYTRESRDFQLFARLMDAVENDVRASAASLRNDPLTPGTDGRMLDLVASTIGFWQSHKYDSRDMRALCASFKSIMARKGTKAAIEDTVRLLLQAQGITSQALVVMTTSSGTGSARTYPYKVELYIPAQALDAVLLEDMLDYVLPTGFVCSVYRSSLNAPAEASDAIALREEVTHELYDGASQTLSSVTGDVSIGVVAAPFAAPAAQ